MRQAPLFVLSILLSSSVSCANHDSATHEDDPSTWYNRYKRYHPYCSTPMQMSKRSIPPLNSAGTSRVDTRLVQVTAIIRHGSRAPYTSDMQCWDGYWTNPKTGIWDCDLVTMMAPPPPPPFLVHDEEEKGMDDEDTASHPEEEAMFLFEKRYDALHNPPFLTNELNGTCQSGQLLLRGYVQELTNGHHLRDAYIFDNETSTRRNKHGRASDERMRLFDLTKEVEDAANGATNKPYEEPNLYYRADDEQRTLMSGQILIRGLFSKDFLRNKKAENEDGEIPVIVTHTADYSRDIVGGGRGHCPHLDDLEKEAKSSANFKALISSEEAMLLKKFVQEKLGTPFESFDGQDCLMTTMCNDRPLPDVLNDYVGDKSNRGGNAAMRKGQTRPATRRARTATSSRSESNHTYSGSEQDVDYGENLFERLFNFQAQSKTFYAKYNDGAYSKFAMGPLWAEIISNIDPLVNEGQMSNNAQEAEDDENFVPPPKLALFSGHDWTLLELLISLGVWDDEEIWVPYASMIVIELHEIMDDSPDTKIYPNRFVFRLLYNGQTLTSKMKGCPPKSDMCDVDVLLRQVQPFASVNRDCTSRRTTDDFFDTNELLLSSDLSEKMGKERKVETMDGRICNQQPRSVTLLAVYFVIGMVLCSMITFVCTFVSLTGRFPSPCGRRRDIERKPYRSMAVDNCNDNGNTDYGAGENKPLLAR